ncbi:MAG: SET domain-containing protein-lysine N-methyltransferase [Elusimicrobia bacterium]|nr:SET domain-containing protein-lysine N-methyltransferase [Elusimicrobiota bacterium]
MVRLASSAHGQGVFAERPYAAGEVILVFTGEAMTTAEADRRGVRHHCLDIGPGRQLYADPPARFLNHSCDPNAGLIDAVTLAAIHPIAAGEEISFDYSTCVPDSSWSLECRCGAPSCRGLVAGWPALDANTRRRLLALKIVPAWLRGPAVP